MVKTIIGIEVSRGIVYLNCFCRALTSIFQDFSVAAILAVAETTGRSPQKDLTTGWYTICYTGKTAKISRCVELCKWSIGILVGIASKSQSIAGRMRTIVLEGPDLSMSSMKGNRQGSLDCNEP